MNQLLMNVPAHFTDSCFISLFFFRSLIMIKTLKGKGEEADENTSSYLLV